MKVLDSVDAVKLVRDLPIITVYLFGSASRGDAGPLSDYDLAFQVQSKLPTQMRFKLKLTLMDRFTRALKTDRVDVVLLDEAPPLLAHRILKDGKVLYCRNPLQRIRYEFRRINEYLDFQDDLDRFAAATLAASPAGAVHG
jgi:uncharacterized protein